MNIDKQIDAQYNTHKRLYKVWVNMKQRCYNPKNDNYYLYGGRGITICEEWRSSFDNFEKWALINGYDENAPKGECTIDRINTFGNYEPNNCRWVSMEAQNLNRKANRIIEYNGETHTLVEWANILGINYSTLLYRFRRGWNTERAFAELKKKYTQDKGRDKIAEFGKYSPLSWTNTEEE